MTDTVPVRVTDGDVWVDGEHLTLGDETEIPAVVYERIPGSFEQLDNGDDNDETEDAKTQSADASGEASELTEDDLDPHPEDLTVGELEARIEGVDDIGLLRTILGAERASEDRTTATDTLEARIRELEE
ncbi:hypothetical protein [Haloarcula montana]|uniref:hypothetical protein n=1 Tax=Haloarcula montana TaxID=3111776 RepID=UPI002D76CC43|nr:hypothetical protein [Haloarcula sp. GH36]